MRPFYLLWISGIIPVDVLHIIQGYWNPCGWCYEGSKRDRLIRDGTQIACPYCSNSRPLFECEVCAEHCMESIAMWRFCSQDCRDWINALSPQCQKCSRRAKKEFMYCYCSHECQMTPSYSGISFIVAVSQIQQRLLP